MTPLRIPLALHTPLGTPLAGDTLFGQLCWTVREAHGTAELVRLLDGYPQGRPWLVVGDGLPAGFLPRPTVPPPAQIKPEERKGAKGKRWIALVDAAKPLPELLAAAQNDEVVFGKGLVPVATRAHHNTLNRLTGTTGTGEFAPYAMPQTHYSPGQTIDVWCVLDATRCPPERLRELFAALGSSGFGRDASIGLGKFEVAEPVRAVPPAPTFPNAWWTLGPCAPQGQGFDGEKSFWRVLTRFGRHGNALALSDNPFKHPVLLAAAGAVFVPTGEFAPRLFVGQGLSGVSAADEKTVHQGYTPVLPLQMEVMP
jgi:CRISPR-associated protein Csm4